MWFRSTQFTVSDDDGDGGGGDCYDDDFLYLSFMNISINKYNYIV